MSWVNVAGEYDTYKLSNDDIHSFFEKLEQLDKVIAVKTAGGLLKQVDNIIKKFQDNVPKDISDEDAPYTSGFMREVGKLASLSAATFSYQLTELDAKLQMSTLVKQNLINSDSE